MVEHKRKRGECSRRGKTMIALALLLVLAVIGVAVYVMMEGPREAGGGQLDPYNAGARPNPGGPG